MILKDVNFGLFMTTRAMSLENWDKIGMLSREIKPYQKLAEFFKEVYIFTYGSEIDKKYLNVFPKNVRIITRPVFLPVIIYSFLLPFIHAGKLKNIQILKTNQMDGSWPAVIAKKLYGAKLIVRCGYEWLEFLEKAKRPLWKRFAALWVEKFAYHNADQIILTSASSKNFVIQRFNINSTKIQIIPNYIDTELFKPLDIPKEKNRIIFIGRLEKEKNLINLFSAVEGLGVELVVVGEGSLGAKLAEIARLKGLDVAFKGNIPQAGIPLELNKSEVFILPSLHEGNPKVLLEAMSCGLPCIGTDVDGINSIISDKEDGILTATDTASLKKAISELLGNKELCAKLGINARKKIEANNSFSVFIEKELSVYKSV